MVTLFIHFLFMASISQVRIAPFMDPQQYRSASEGWALRTQRADEATAEKGRAVVDTAVGISTKDRIEMVKSETNRALNQTSGFVQWVAAEWLAYSRQAGKVFMQGSIDKGSMLDTHA